MTRTATQAAPDRAEDHPFDLATALQPDGAGGCLAQAAASYWGFVGPFGGATAGTLMRALLQHPGRRGDPIAFTVNYAAPVEAGAYRIALRLARATRSTQHWSLEVLQGDDPAPRATATAILAERRRTWSHQVAAPPAMQPREALPEYRMDPAMPWVDRYRFHFDTGAPISGPEPLAEPAPAFSQMWLSDAPERVVDLCSLAAMADAFFGRIFHVLGTIVPFGTVSMTSYMHVSAAELADLACDRVIGRVDSRRFHLSYGDHSAELWSPDGQLLATSHQIAYFKA